MKRTTPIVCAKAPRYIAYVPAERCTVWFGRFTDVWCCSFCGQRVKVVA